MTQGVRGKRGGGAGGGDEENGGREREREGRGIQRGCT